MNSQDITQAQLKSNPSIIVLSHDTTQSSIACYPKSESDVSTQSPESQNNESEIDLKDDDWEAHSTDWDNW